MAKLSMAHRALENLIRENPEANQNELLDRFYKIAGRWKGKEREAFLREVFDMMCKELEDEGRIDRLPRDAKH